MRDYAAVRGFLIAHECLAEMHHAFEPGQQHLPQRDATDRAMLRNGVEALRRIHLIGREENLSMLCDEADAFGRLAASPREGVEQMRRQAFVQRGTAGRIDVHAIALDAICARAVALIDRDTDA
jgi:hypothetical protein